MDTCEHYLGKGDNMNEKDLVNHPSHYCQEGSMECIDEMVEVFGIEATMHFCLLNVWKYRKRALYKNGEQDIHKSDWYMKKYIELLEMQGEQCEKDYEEEIARRKEAKLAEMEK